MAKEQRTYIAKRRPPNMPAGCQSSRLAGFLKLSFSPAKLEYSPPIGQALPGYRLQSNCLTREAATKGGWQRKKAEGQKAKVQGKTDCITYIHKAAHGLATDLSLNTPSGWNCADLTKHCSKVTRQENKRKKTKARLGGRAGR